FSYSPIRYSPPRPRIRRTSRNANPGGDASRSVTYLVAMELRQLASFLAVVEEGQFARAAVRLFLSPPALTGHIQPLARQLGVQPLDRSPIALPPAGERLVPHARTMLAAANAASDAVTDLRMDGEMPLRVGVMAPGSAELTPAILRAFHRAAPHTPLSIESVTF